MNIRQRMLKVFCMITIVVCGCICSACSRKEIVIKEDTHFKVIETEETDYFYEIYNTDGKLVKSGKSYRTEPMIDYIDPETIEILIAAGTDTFYCIYYDIAHDRFSEQYDSPIAAKYNTVAFLDHRDAECVLVIKDMFEERNDYKEYCLDFATAISPVVYAEFLGEDTLLVSYQSGDSFEEKTTLLHFWQGVD